MDAKTVVNYRWGLFWSFISAFLWATVYVSTRYLMGGKELKVDPVTLSLLRFVMGGVILFTICFCRYRKELFALRRYDYLAVALLSQLSVVGMSIFLFWGQRYTTATNSSMIMSSSPVLIMLLGLFFGEKINGFQVVGMIISTLGCMMVIEVISTGGWQYSMGSFKGDLLVLVSASCWAVGAILAKRIMRSLHDLAVTAWSMIFASISLLTIELIMKVTSNAVVMPSDAATWCLVLYLGIFPTAIGFYAWNAALNRISLNTVSVMQYLTPIMTITMAWIILGENLSLFKIIGAFMVIGGVIFSSRGKLVKSKHGNAANQSG